MIDVRPRDKPNAACGIGTTAIELYATIWIINPIGHGVPPDAKGALVFPLKLNV